MTNIVPLKLDDGSVVFIEKTEGVYSQYVALDNKNEEESPVSKNGSVEKAIQKFSAIENTIRAYTSHTLNAFKKVASANIDKVTIEFGITVGGEAGIPYVTKGTAESSIKISVECSFPKEGG